MAKQYKSCKGIPFKKPQPQRIYMMIRRADNPLEKAAELNVLDIEKLREKGFNCPVLEFSDLYDLFDDKMIIDPKYYEIRQLYNGFLMEGGS